MIRSGPLDPSAQAAVRALLDSAADADGVTPVSEHALLGLANPSWTHLRALTPEGTLAGYASADDAGTGELVVHPDHRRRGFGRELLSRLLDAGALRVWAHGDHPGAAALAATAGLDRVRALWQMSRPLAPGLNAAGPGGSGETLPEPRLPEGVLVRTFRPGTDDAEWLSVNAEAFADHPEQGSWSSADLQQRMSQPWFDPRGFFVAYRAARMVGFHWTKLVDGTGEVYILGVAPSEQGSGLGKALALVGLRYLRDNGAVRALLYVEEANGAAIRLYTGLGFTRVGVDAQYGRRYPGGG